MKKVTINAESVTTENRLSEIRAALRANKVDSYIVSHLPTIRYLTNFSGSNATLIIGSKNVHFITDDRYTEQVRSELYAVKNMHIHIQRDVWKYVASKKLLKSGQTVGFESNVVPVDTASNIKRQVRGIRLKKVPNLARRTTISKSPAELASIQMAASMADKVYAYILDFVKPGMREIDVAAEVSYQGRTLGSEGDAFEIILVAGEHGAFVHGRASQRKLKIGDVVTLDFGCTYNGFHSDMTRTFSIGKAPKAARKAWSAVHEAHRRAIEAIRVGMKTSELDAIARNVINAAGYGDFFKHSLGHGLGIEVHESPRISSQENNDRLVENCVITIEPGIYVPGEFGMRLEDDVHVMAQGPRLLTTSSREMIEL